MFDELEMLVVRELGSCTCRLLHSARKLENAAEIYVKWKAIFRMPIKNFAPKFEYNFNRIRVVQSDLIVSA